MKQEGANNEKTEKEADNYGAKGDLIEMKQSEELPMRKWEAVLTIKKQRGKVGMKGERIWWCRWREDRWEN